MTASAPKAGLRRELRERRRCFVERIADREACERAVSDRILAHIGQATMVAAYLPLGDEIDPLPALEAIAARGIGTALPHVADRPSEMRFLRWSPGDPLMPGPYGLQQPRSEAPSISPDLILTPLVGFDRAMRRLGQGAGFYDRAFARLPGARRIGLAWSVQEAPLLPSDEWDVPLHAVATEKEWIEPDL